MRLFRGVLLGVILTALATSYTARCCTREAELAATQSSHLSQVAQPSVRVKKEVRGHE